MPEKIKYTLKVVESKREYVTHADEDRLLIHYKIFKTSEAKKTEPLLIRHRKLEAVIEKEWRKGKDKGDKKLVKSSEKQKLTLEKTLSKIKIHGVKEHFPVGISKDDLKLALKKVLDLYTSEHQPVPEEVKQRLKVEEKADKLSKDMEGFKI